MTNTHYDKFKIWFSKKGYPYIWLGGKDTPLHVYVWEKKNGSKPKHHDIHHIDGDKTNYSLDNLQLVTPSMHRRIHAGWIANKNGVWIKKNCSFCKKLLLLSKFGFIKTRNVENSICTKCSREKSKIYRKNKPNYQINHNQYVKKWREQRKRSGK